MKKLLTICIVITIMAVCNQAIALDFTEVNVGDSSQVDITDEFADYCVTFRNVYRYIDSRDPWHEIGPQGGPTGYGISNGIVANNGQEAEVGYIFFSQPVPYVEIDWWTIADNVLYVDAFDTGDSLVDSFSGNGSGTETLSGGALISYMTFHDSGGFVQIANMRFPCLEQVQLDIKPGSCPNPLNPKSRGVVPVAIVGTLEFDPTLVDIDTVLLEGVSPVKADMEDSTQPGDYDPSDCYDCFNADDWLNCDLDGDGVDDAYCGDGIYDLILYFDTQELVDAIGGAAKGDCLELTLTGSTVYGEEFETSDSMVILKNIGGGG